MQTNQSTVSSLPETEHFKKLLGCKKTYKKKKKKERWWKRKRQYTDRQREQERRMGKTEKDTD